jgi:hypothetical protein
MRLLGHFSNASSSQQAIFNALPDESIESMAQPDPLPASGRLGNGEVQRAVVQVLAPKWRSTVEQA